MYRYPDGLSSSSCHQFFKLQDRSQPEVTDKYFHDVPFDAYFASELPDFHQVSSMPGVDGFVMKVDALYKVLGMQINSCIRNHDWNPQDCWCRRTVECAHRHRWHKGERRIVGALSHARIFIELGRVMRWLLSWREWGSSCPGGDVDVPLNKFTVGCAHLLQPVYFGVHTAFSPSVDSLAHHL